VRFVAVSILLAMSVYQIIVSDKLPSSFNSAPVIGQYSHIVVVVAAVVIVVIVVVVVMSLLLFLLLPITAR